MFLTRQLIRNNWMKIRNNIDNLSDYTEVCYHFKRRRKNLLSFDGYNHCGALCLSTYSFLNKNNIDCKVVKSKIGYGKHLEDHVYIELENNIILDPSYKQFLRDCRGYNTIYQNVLYEQLDEFYIGDKKGLFKIFNNMIKLNKKIYKYENTNIEDIRYFYDKPECITEKFKTNIHLVKY